MARHGGGEGGGGPRDRTCGPSLRRDSLSIAHSWAAPALALSAEMSSALSAGAHGSGSDTLEGVSTSVPGPGARVASWMMLRVGARRSTASAGGVPIADQCAPVVAPRVGGDMPTIVALGKRVGARCGVTGERTSPRAGDESRTSIGASGVGAEASTPRAVDTRGTVSSERRVICGCERLKLRSTVAKENASLGLSSGFLARAAISRASSSLGTATKFDSGGGVLCRWAALIRWESPRSSNGPRPARSS